MMVDGGNKGKNQVPERGESKAFEDWTRFPLVLP